MSNRAIRRSGDRFAGRSTRRRLEQTVKRTNNLCEMRYPQRVLDGLHTIYDHMNRKELDQVAKRVGIKNHHKMDKDKLHGAIIQHHMNMRFEKGPIT